MLDDKNKKDWFKLKKYPHIGFPIEAKERTIWVEDYVTNPIKIKEHSFLPFIHKTSKVRKFRKQYSDDNGVPVYTAVDGINKILRHSNIKKRELYYAGHLDSLIFSYYSELLSIEYEKKITQFKLNDIVTAYRKIPVNPDKTCSSNKCNIDFAADVFSVIKTYPDDNFVVIAFDIKGFFDNLNHRILREKWISLYNTPKLRDDHFNVYKHITRFSYIDIVDIFNLYQNDIYVDSTERHKPKKKRKRISKIKYLKKQNAIAFCTKKEFLLSKTKLVKKDRWIKNNEGKNVLKDFGIPQGSPISSVLANLYMVDFDKEINDSIRSIGGFYWRYSDDMVVICPSIKLDYVQELFETEIKKVKLEIQKAKTQVFHFERKSGSLICGQQYKDVVNYNKNFIYLGMEYDGKKVRVKSASISGFYRKMKRTVKRAKHYASNPYSKNFKEIFKSRIFKRFSYKGARRRRKYIWNAKSKYFEISSHYDWGNFLSYTEKAKKMRIKNCISSQTKRHWHKLTKLLK